MQGIRLLTKSSLEVKSVAGMVAAAAQTTANPAPEEGCKTMGSRMQNVLDMFTPISGVVKAVALAALGYNPEAAGKVVQALRDHRAGTP